MRSTSLSAPRTLCRLAFLTLILFLSASCEPVSLSEEDEEKQEVTNEDGTSDDAQQDLPSDTLTVAEAQSATLDSAVVVKGYIVGYVPGTQLSSAYFNAPSAENTNILLADDVNETNPQNCLPVQLTKDSEARAFFNLTVHPERFHQYVVVKGTLAEYFKVRGVKSATSFAVLTAPSASSEQSGGAKDASTDTDAGASDASSDQGSGQGSETSAGQPSGELSGLQVPNEQTMPDSAVSLVMRKDTFR